jgi:putative ABC transport system permease protein
MIVITQVVAVTLLNLRSILQRTGASLVIVVGIAGVVAVLISVLSMSTGFRKTIENSVHANRVIVLSPGVDSESESDLSRAEVLAAIDAPGVKKGTGSPVPVELTSI